MRVHNLSVLPEEQILNAIKSAENIKNTLLLEDMIKTDTVYGPHTLDLIKNGKPETRTFMTFLARQIMPESFLEVGVRRGWSTASVIIASPECEVYAFDEWHENYGGSANPGPSFVQSELAKFGYKKPINFISGDSHVTLSTFFNQFPDKMFDMILVDGDHTVDGAYQDLMDTMPHINVGGVMVFDDIIDCEGLQGVWDALVKTFPNFRYISYRENKPGVAFAVRIS
jgi:predicted O-methyltransferase YrrM